MDDDCQEIIANHKVNELLIDDLKNKILKISFKVIMKTYFYYWMWGHLHTFDIILDQILLIFIGSEYSSKLSPKN